jgi:hypothetical protein
MDSTASPPFRYMAKYSNEKTGGQEFILESAVAKEV